MVIYAFELPIVVPYHINTRIAFKVWGIDAGELERNRKTGTAQEFERLEITPPLHPNCRCKLNPLVDGAYLGYTENRNFYAEKLGISADALEELKQGASLEDLLFVENIAYQYSKFFHDSPSEEKILSALYVVKNYDEKPP